MSTCRLAFIAGSSIASGLRLTVQVPGGALHAVEIDTGSVGLLIPRTVLGPAYQDFDPANDTTFGYVSSGNTYRGQWVEVPLTIGSPDDGDLATTSIEVFAVDTPESFDHGLLGIGFDIGDLADGGPPRNPLLHLALDGETLGAAYVIGDTGIDVGADLSNGFGTVALERNHDDDDWTQPMGTLTLPGADPIDLRVLIDTGIPDMLLWLDPADRPPAFTHADTLPDGTAVAISVPATGAALAYRFVTGDSTNPATPPSVVWRSGHSLNTGRSPLAIYDYLYDSDAGLIGFRPRRTA